jgi:hypothetical protein
MANRRPGYYRDERGREYYWDGQTRSYIPVNSYDQFNQDMQPLMSCFVVAMAIVYGIGVLYLMAMFFALGAILILIAAVVLLALYYGG